MSTKIEEVDAQRPHQCSVCVHLHRDAKRACDAYPTGIPRDILTELHDHRQPFIGDHGIRFAAWPGKRHPLDVVGANV